MYRHVHIGAFANAVILASIWIEMVDEVIGFPMLDGHIKLEIRVSGANVIHLLIMLLNGWAVVSHALLCIEWVVAALRTILTAAFTTFERAVCLVNQLLVDTRGCLVEMNIGFTNEQGACHQKTKYATDDKVR